MRKLHPELVQEYFERIQEQYPELSLQDISEICHTPFLMVRREMEKGELTTIRLKYFGTFTVYPKRVKAVLSKMEKDFKELKLTPKIYFGKKEMIEKYLKRIKDED
jgi:nucleoid DNA-binding protein